MLSPESREKNALRARAVARAHKRLADRHPDEYRRFLEQERRRVGLPRRGGLRRRACVVFVEGRPRIEVHLFDGKGSAKSDQTSHSPDGEATP